MNRPPRPVLLLLAVLALLGLTAAHAAAAPPALPTQAVQPPPTTFGIRTSGATAPDDRGRFTFGVTPGALLSDHVAVSNFGAKELTLRLYASDAFNTPEGGFDILAAGRESRDAGAWIALDRDTVTVPGNGGVVIVPFRVTVPPDATPGDHAGGIVASLLSDVVEADGNRVQVDNRVGARVYLRVAGELRPALSVENLAGTYRHNLNPFGAGSAEATYVVRNTGNLRLEGDQLAQIVLPWGARIDSDELPALPELLPGSAITVTATVPSVLPAGWATAEVRLAPRSLPGDVNPELATEVADATFPAVPWALLAVLALIGLVLWLRRRRRRASPVAGPRTPVGATA